jgi:hypothetical protein
MRKLALRWREGRLFGGAFSHIVKVIRAPDEVRPSRIHYFPQSMSAILYESAFTHIPECPSNLVFRVILLPHRKKSLSFSGFIDFNSTVDLREHYWACSVLESVEHGGLIGQILFVH